MGETSDDSGTAMFEFIVDGVLLAIVCPIGIIANIFNLIILTREKMKSSFACYLLHLSIHDMLFLMCKFILHVVEVFRHHHNGGVVNYYRTLCFFPSPFVMAVLHTVRTGSSWVTVGVSFERYSIVCHPLKAFAWSSSSVRRAVLCNIFIAFFVVSFNLPHFFEYQVIDHFDNITNETYSLLVRTSFAKTYMFGKVYDLCINMVVINILPFILLPFLNLSIYRAIRKASKKREEMTENRRTDRKNVTVLFCVVIIYFLCYMPSLIFMVMMITETSYLVAKYLRILLHLTEAVNSAANFIVYSVVNENFRETVRQTLATILCYKKRDDNKNTIELTPPSNSSSIPT